MSDQKNLQKDLQREQGQGMKECGTRGDYSLPGRVEGIWLDGTWMAALGRRGSLSWNVWKTNTGS
jgi:hypothetical protein